MFSRLLSSAIIVGLLASAPINVSAQAIETPPILDGTTVTYIYQNGMGAHIEFYDGMLKYEWVSGPRKGKGNKDLKYRSRKIAENVYVINWLEESHPDFMTLIFNFENNVMYSSGILRFGKDQQKVVFDGGIIQDLKLVTRN